MTKIILYKNNKKTLIKLIEELQDYLIQIDPLKRICKSENFGEKYIRNLLRKINKNNGAIFIANKKNIPVGFIAGIIEKQNAEDLLQCVPTKTGKILELIVSMDIRRKNIGSLLMKKMEEYFKKHKCDIICVEVFEPNFPAHNFYRKLGYKDRMINMIKSY